MSKDAYITSFDGHSPKLADDVFVDRSARIIGRVTLEAGANVWPGAVLRADEEEIVIGAGSAVLDMALLESPHGHPVIVEPGALISHKATLHGASVRTGALVGIGAIVLDGAVVGPGALVGAGALVPPRMEVPAGTLVLGQPARPIRELKPAELESVKKQLEELRRKALLYMGR